MIQDENNWIEALRTWRHFEWLFSEVFSYVCPQMDHIRGYTESEDGDDARREQLNRSSGNLASLWVTFLRCVISYVCSVLKWPTSEIQRCRGWWWCKTRTIESKLWELCVTLSDCRLRLNVTSVPALVALRITTTRGDYWSNNNNNNNNNNNIKNNSINNNKKLQQMILLAGSVFKSPLSRP